MPHALRLTAELSNSQRLPSPSGDRQQPHDFIVGIRSHKTPKSRQGRQKACEGGGRGVGARKIGKFVEACRPAWGLMINLARFPMMKSLGYCLSPRGLKED